MRRNDFLWRQAISSEQWCRLYKADTSPRLSRELLIRAVAHRMQEVALGGLHPELQRQPHQIALVPHSGLPTNWVRSTTQSLVTLISRPARHPEQLLPDRWQRPHPRGDDRERITRTRQAAEALFAPKRQVAGELVFPPPPADQSAPKSRVLGISPAARPVMRSSRPRSAPNRRRRARSRARNLRAVALGQIRHDGCASRQCLWGCRRRDQTHSAQSLTTTLGFRPQTCGLRSPPQPHPVEGWDSGNRYPQQEPQTSIQSS